MNITAAAKRSILGLVGAAAITASIVAPAFAADQVTQVINGNGSLTAFVSDASLSAVTYSNAATSSSGSLTLSADDPRGTSVGWNVTIASSDFDYAGASSIGLDLPSTGFVIGTPATPSMTAGQAVNAIGPLAVAGGSLNTPRKTISAGVGSGSGSYTQALPVSLAIPAYSQAGTYTAVLTVLITSGL